MTHLGWRRTTIEGGINTKCCVFNTLFRKILQSCIITVRGYAVDMIMFSVTLIRFVWLSRSHWYTLRIYLHSALCYTTVRICNTVTWWGSVIYSHLTAKSHVIDVQYAKVYITHLTHTCKAESIILYSGPECFFRDQITLYEFGSNWYINVRPKLTPK